MRRALLICLALWAAPVWAGERCATEEGILRNGFLVTMKFRATNLFDSNDQFEQTLRFSLSGKARYCKENARGVYANLDPEMVISADDFRLAGQCGPELLSEYIAYYYDSGDIRRTFTCALLAHHTVYAYLMQRVGFSTFEAVDNSLFPLIGSFRDSIPHSDISIRSVGSGSKDNRLYQVMLIEKTIAFPQD